MIELIFLLLPLFLVLILYFWKRENIIRGWNIFKESLSFLKARKGLFLVPFLAFALMVVSTVCIFALLYLIFVFLFPMNAIVGVILTIILFIILGYLYFFIRVLCTAMITAGVYGSEFGDDTFTSFRHLKGDYPALAKFAALLFGFSILTSIIEGLLQRAGPIGAVVGKISMNILRWAVAFVTTYTIAAIVIENIYSIKSAVKRSIHIIKSTWVEVIFKDFIGILFGIIILLFIFGEIGIIYITFLFIPSILNIYTIITAITAAFIAGIVLALIYYIISVIYVTKLYLYFIKAERGIAVPGEAPWSAPMGYYNPIVATPERYSALERIERFFS
ncbi:MAG: hypothetical protein AB1779_09785 [Candidatus Thermoplasmatota archaeon]